MADLVQTIHIEVRSAGRDIFGHQHIVITSVTILVIGAAVLFYAVACGVVDIRSSHAAAGVGFELVVEVVAEGFGTIGYFVALGVVSKGARTFGGEPVGVVVGVVGCRAVGH